MAFTDISTDYRRRARRLRRLHAGDASKLVPSLMVLSARHDAMHRSPLPTVERPAELRGFVDHVRDGMEGPVMRFSTRQQLLHEAKSLGIARFDANLII